MVLNVAAKAVIVNNEGKVLILREAATNPDGTNVGKYHMPGGRLDVGEAFIDGLHREVQEETGIDIEPFHPVHVDEWRPVIRGTVHQIVGVFMLCRAKSDTVRLSEEHDHFAWIDPAELNKYDLLGAEGRAIEAAVKYL